MSAGNGARHTRPLVLSVVGTRPEAIKMAPLVRALARRPGIDQQVVLTGQHQGLAATLGEEAAGLVHQLPYRPAGRSMAALRESLHAALCKHISGRRPDLVLVQGDTASALAGALAANDCGVPVGHVEAGLRSFDLRQPWPEEGNRVVIDAFSDLLFAPTEGAAANLRRDWRVTGEIFVTGNTGTDALLETHARLCADAGVDPEDRTILVTCHRKENQGAPTRSICEALRRLVREHGVRIALPLHPNRHVRSALEAELEGEPGIALLEPLGYAEMVRLIARSWLILTDSGGLQEEGPPLGKPVLVLRNVTERGEAIESDNVALVGTRADDIVAAVAALIEEPGRYARMARPCLPFGDGRASERIAGTIQAWLEPRRMRA